MHLALYNDVIVFDQATKLVYIICWVHLDDDTTTINSSSSSSSGAASDNDEATPPPTQPHPRRFEGSTILIIVSSQRHHLILLSMPAFGLRKNHHPNHSTLCVSCTAPAGWWHTG